ncbi:recombinase RecT [Spongiactinospora gelatinilytica]|uniref:recombinase RecT n=1 Tax=Spongiactinospora gelatinilytica TaxID=2666298 RepID=UPI001314ABDC|nr:recombinase RecT [Spongiactinospora gelatinilytica]
MTRQTVSQAVAKRDNGPGALIKQYEGDFASVLPSHITPETFVRLSQGLLRRNAELREHAEANPGAFLAALLDCARLGHEPGTDAYALVPFKDKGVPTIVGIEQYQGEIERMYRAGAVVSVKAEVVRLNDFYHFDEKTMTKPDHRPGWFATDPPGQSRHPAFLSVKDRGELIGVYAYAEFPSGAVSRVVSMAKDEVMLHRAEARTKKIWDGPWEKSMWLKTAVHELEKWVPTSSEYRREQLRAVAEADVIRQRPTYDVTQAPPPPAPMSMPTEDITDAEIVDEPGEVDDWPPVTKPGSGGGTDAS